MRQNKIKEKNEKLQNEGETLENEKKKKKR